jgi:hypothetical protein
MSLTAETESAYESYAAARPNAVLQAVFLSKNTEFQRWIEKLRQGCWGPVTETMAANFIREYCQITSRSELNTNADAHKRFEQLLNKFKTDSESKNAA